MLLEDPENLNVLRQTPDIESLFLRHFRRVRSLEPLRLLTNLKKLDLRALPSWDADGRNLVIDSFEPLTALPKLEIISVKGVVPEHGRLEPLGRVPSLKKVSVNSRSSFYQLEDFAALSVVLPKARASLRPARPFVKCTRCKKHLTLFLKGAKARQARAACPECQRKQLLAHLERWNAAGGLPKYERLHLMTAEELRALFGADADGEDDA